MIVILCHPDDAAALWLHAAWQSAGVSGVELVSVEQLVFSRQIVHHLDTGGDAGRIALHDGRVIDTERCTGIVNRVRYLPTAHFAQADVLDRPYAAAELSAFLLAWLHGGSRRVLNPPRPGALGGGGFHAATLMHAAATTGLPTAPWQASTLSSPQPTSSPLPTDRAIVFDHQVYGPVLPASLRDGCIRLAALLGVPLLEVLFHRSQEHGWRFVGVDDHVDFRTGGRVLASALARAAAEADAE